MIRTKFSINRYTKWGYVCIAPFLLFYTVYSLIPLISTIVNSFFENYTSGLKQVGPTFVGFSNYARLLSDESFFIYLKNTLFLWILGFIPQILLSLLLAAWFSDRSLNLKCTGFFKSVIYLPNLIMASAFSSLFLSLFGLTGPINSFLVDIGALHEPITFFSHVLSTRLLIVFMNFLMWFGNTTLLIMAGMMSIDSSLNEAARVDGATNGDIFFKITLPLIKPILLYVLITSLIGGMQLFDVPQVLTNGTGNPLRSSMTLIMFLNNYLFSKNYGMGGAISTLMFVVTAILSLIIFYINRRETE